MGGGHGLCPGKGFVRSLQDFAFGREFGAGGHVNESRRKGFPGRQSDIGVGVSYVPVVATSFSHNRLSLVVIDPATIAGSSVRCSSRRVCFP